MAPRSRLRTLVVTAALGLVVACGGSGAEHAASPSTTATVVTTTATTAPTTTPRTIPPTTTSAPLTFPPQEFARGNVNRPASSITFDCGASAAPTPAILEVLRREGIRTTFFMTGAWAEQNPDLARQIANEHEIANHTFSHRDLLAMSDAEIVDEMEHAEAALVAASGRPTKPLWRAPYGSRNAHLLQVVADAGWPYHIFWTADALDWQQISPGVVRANMNRGAVNGGIVLAHCGSPQTAEILPQVVADFRAAGLTLTTVTEVLRQ
jgi:peptidoglycan/xylan/chitin deacetylase (PgdA/CDA1 family)